MWTTRRAETPRDRINFAINDGFTLEYWRNAFAVEELNDAMLTSLQLAALSTVISTVIGTLMAAWSSANKYALIGGMRAAAQLIAYELPIVLTAAVVAMLAIAAPAGAADDPGAVYALSNAASGNAVLVYDRSSDGSLAARDVLNGDASLGGFVILSSVIAAAYAWALENFTRMDLAAHS